MVLRKKWLPVLLAIFIIAALTYGFMPKPVGVETVTAARGPFQVVIEEEGKTHLKDRFEISAPVTGMLFRLHWDVGDPVQAGKAL